MKEVRKRAIYESCRILSPSGELMCLVREKKARWYLERGLARLVAEAPLTVQLVFEPRGRGHSGDAFYTRTRPNVCAVCGATEGLTLHHIVPHGYRRHFPEEVKNHSCHDLVPLCIPCHRRYESMALELRRRLAEDYGAPLDEAGQSYDRRTAKAKKAASALERHGTRDDVRIPAERLEELRGVLRDFFGTPDVDDALIAEALRLDPCAARTSGRSHGEVVVANVGDLQAFVERWRRHFVESLRPAHMPAEWRVDRTVGR
ncbi:MAG: HNH endonuclease [Planctomycetes bacterium]|nr:HNH endonuclease [Planctomycetota bacterium]